MRAACHTVRVPTRSLLPPPMKLFVVAGLVGLVRCAVLARDGGPPDPCAVLAAKYKNQTLIPTDGLYDAVREAHWQVLAASLFLATYCGG
jgi:hypothetical protein